MKIASLFNHTIATVTNALLIISLLIVESTLCRTKVVANWKIPPLTRKWKQSHFCSGPLTQTTFARPYFWKTLGNNHIMSGHLWASELAKESTGLNGEKCALTHHHMRHRMNGRMRNILENTWWCYIHTLELCVTVRAAGCEKTKKESNENCAKWNTGANNNNGHLRAHSKLNCRFGHQSVIATPAQDHLTYTADEHAERTTTIATRLAWVALRFEIAH